MGSSAGIFARQPPQEPAPPSKEPPQRSQLPGRSPKQRIPQWGRAEVEALLDLWAQEEALHDPWSLCPNANIFSRMAQNLAAQGFPSRTREQVWSTVKKLCQVYMKASGGGGAGADTCPHYDRLHAILGKKAVQGPSPPEEEVGDLTTSSKDEGEDLPSTLQLESGHIGWDVSLSSCEAGEGSSAGAAGSEGSASPAAAAAPTTQAPDQQHQLLQWHIQAMERMKEEVVSTLQGDREWQQQAWGQLLQRCDRMCDTIATLTSHVGRAGPHGLALPHPAAPPAQTRGERCRGLNINGCAGKSCPSHS
ncbi:uncharacterized protein LOC106731673 isoform X2 [Pelodiscus sinensis]|uniref:uncharacterized protein LOC106731673 isoform X2 n=1 Tax=Pelodiscus sinensis TaxID=13735 RepID=UPI003F6AB895